METFFKCSIHSHNNKHKKITLFTCAVLLLILPFIPIVTQLLDTKSTDRKMTLLHYIALIVKEKYPELANFYNELHFVDKAAAGEFRQSILKIYDMKN